jgi:aspartate dehydrogenase
LVRDRSRHETTAAAGWPYVDRPEELLAAGPDIIVEAAGHDAVRLHVGGFLRAGIDVMIISIGALADDELLDQVSRSAQEGGSRLLLATGAVGSLDALSAARTLGLQSVTHTIRKPLASLPPSQSRRDTGSPEDVEVFAGSARAAALAFPSNANVVAAVGLAGVGLDRTTVRIIGSASADRNIHEIQATGAFGEFEFRIANRAASDNPRSSLLAAGSLAAALARLSATVRFA